MPCLCCGGDNMEHLIFVLWHDYWKPWIKEQLSGVGYVLGGVAIVAAVFFGWIYLTIITDRLLGG